jgi:hypothetical protein
MPLVHCSHLTYRSARLALVEYKMRVLFKCEDIFFCLEVRGLLICNKRKEEPICHAYHQPFCMIAAIEETVRPSGHCRLSQWNDEKPESGLPRLKIVDERYVFDASLAPPHSHGAFLKRTLAQELDALSPGLHHRLRTPALFPFSFHHHPASPIPCINTHTQLQDLEDPLHPHVPLCQHFHYHLRYRRQSIDLDSCQHKRPIL